MHYVWDCVKTAIFWIGLLIFITEALPAQERITIGTGLKPPLVDSASQPGFLETLVKDAFKRIGLKLDIIILPAGRVLANANKGIEDGCLLRIKGLEQFYPNLVRVPEMLMVSDFVAYSRIKIETGEDISKFDPFAVSYVTGWKIFDKLFSDHKNTVTVNNADQMFLMLKKGRVDVILYERWQGLGIAQNLNLGSIHLVQPPLVSMDMFMYLHRKHEQLIPKLAMTLAEMKKDGTYHKYRHDLLESIEKKN